MPNEKKQPLNKKKAIRNMRKTAMVQPDGTRESHKMAYAGDVSKRRGKFEVFPTVAPKPGKERSTNPADWKQQGLSEARKKGEVVEVKSRRKAQKLSAGSWKKGKDKREAMRDYRADKKARNGKK